MAPVKSQLGATLLVSTSSAATEAVKHTCYTNVYYKTSQVKKCV